MAGHIGILSQTFLKVASENAHGVISQTPCGDIHGLIQVDFCCVQCVLASQQEIDCSSRERIRSSRVPPYLRERNFSGMVFYSDEVRRIPENHVHSICPIEHQCGAAFNGVD